MRMNWASRGNKEPDKNKQLHVMSVKEYEELSEKLSKYKRSFEILKEKFKIELRDDVIESVNMNDNPKTYYIYEVMFVYDRAIYAHDLEQEEYELLEELMNNV